MKGAGGHDGTRCWHFNRQGPGTDTQRLSRFGQDDPLRNLIIQSHKKQLDLGVVVNDMSELDVDGEVVAQTEFFDEGNARFHSIHSCVLSSRKGIEELQHALESMCAESPPELIIIETSGSCHRCRSSDIFRPRAGSS